MASRKPKVKKKERATSATHSQPAPVAATPSTTYISPVNQVNLPALSWYEVVATGFFSGYLPKAPGTWGTLFAALLFFVSARILPNDGIIRVGSVPVSWWALLTGTLATVFGIWASGKLAAEWREDDPGEVVADEFAGMFLACTLIQPDLVGMAAAFLFFRLFDILKPGPIHSLQEMPGGYGIVLDDVLAGVVSAPLALGVQWLVAKFFYA